MSDLMHHPIRGAEVSAAVSATEYRRLLGLPRNRELDGELLERAVWARRWYAVHGRPYRVTRRIALEDINGESVKLSTGHEFRSALLAGRLQKGEAYALVALAASAGHEVAEEVARCWQEGRPDEGFFLDRFAVAVTENLVYSAAAYLCRTWEDAHETLLPHLSPGCGKWDFGDQHTLMAAIAGVREQSGDICVGPLTLMASGALHPQHSVLAALGVSSRKFVHTPEYLCRSCDYSPCAYRRAPYCAATLETKETL